MNPSPCKPPSFKNVSLTKNCASSASECVVVLIRCVVTRGLDLLVVVLGGFVVEVLVLKTLEVVGVVDMDCGVVVC